MLKYSWVFYLLCQKYCVILPRSTGRKWILVVLNVRRTLLTHKTTKIHFGRYSAPDPAGELTTLPRPPSRMGRGYPITPSPFPNSLMPSASRSRRLVRTPQIFKRGYATDPGQSPAAKRFRCISGWNQRTSATKPAHQRWNPTHLLSLA